MPRGADLPEPLANLARRQRLGRSWGSNGQCRADRRRGQGFPGGRPPSRARSRPAPFRPADPASLHARGRQGRSGRSRTGWARSPRRSSRRWSQQVALLDPERLARFPTRKEVDAPPAPARPRACPRRSGRVTAQRAAGVDSSGRPGNAFAHIVLDRRPTRHRPRRCGRATCCTRRCGCAPSARRRMLRQAWTACRDPETPVGRRRPRPAGGARLPRGARARASRDVGRLLERLGRGHAPGHRSDGARSPGRARCEDRSDAEKWIAAVCHLMSPGSSRRFYFHHRRASGLTAAAPPGWTWSWCPAPTSGRCRRRRRADRRRGSHRRIRSRIAYPGDAVVDDRHRGGPGAPAHCRAARAADADRRAGGRRRTCRAVRRSPWRS